MTIILIGKTKYPLFLDTLDVYLSENYKTIVLDLEPGNDIKISLNNTIYISLQRTVFGIRISKTILLAYYLIFYRPKLVHIHVISHSFATILFLFVKNVILTPYGSDYNSVGKQSRMLSFFTQLLCKKAKYITSKSDFMSKALKNILHVNEDKIIKINWGVTPDFYANQKDNIIRSSLDIPNDVKVFICIRNMQPLYRKIEILESFIQYKIKTKSNAHLIILCRRPALLYLEEIEKIISLIKFKDNIHLIKEIAYSDMPEYFNSSDAIVSFVSHDGMPHVLYEAMATKTFPILTDLENYKELITHKENGYLVLTKEDLENSFAFVENNILDEGIKSNYNLIKKAFTREIQTKKFMTFVKFLIENDK